MVNMNHLDYVAENMLMRKISKDSDFYEYIKAPAVMKVLISELLKSENRKGGELENNSYYQALKRANARVDSIFARRKNLYNFSIESDVLQRSVQGLSEKGNLSCKEALETAGKAILALLEDMVVHESEREPGGERDELADELVCALTEYEQADLQLLEEYQRSVEQTKTLESEGARGDMESTQNEMIGTEKSQRRLRRRRAIQEEGELEVEVNKEDYLSEYLSTLSTEDLELLMRPITEPAVKIEDTKKTKNYKINLKKTAKGVALAIGILVTCFNVVKVTGFSLEDMWQKHLNEITVTVGGPEYGVPENEAEAMMNFIMLASKDAKVSYSVPSRLEKSLRAGDITNDEFVMDALKDIGMKVNLGFNMSEILEYLFENLLAYRVKDAIGKDIGRYGDESYYKDYKDVGMEDITLSPDYVGIHKPGELIYRIRAGEKVIFESNPYSSQIPDDVKYLMYFCGKDISWTINNPKKEELQDFHKCLSSFYEKKLTIEGDRLISSPATKEISFER